jgi:hypothetical protein
MSLGKFSTRFEEHPDTQSCKGDKQENSTYYQQLQEHNIYFYSLNHLSTYHPSLKEERVDVSAFPPGVNMKGGYLIANITYI